MSATKSTRAALGEAESREIYGAKPAKGVDNKLKAAPVGRKNIFGRVVPPMAPAPAPVHTPYYKLGKVQHREDGGDVQGSQLFPQVQSPSFASNSDYSSSDDQPQSLLGKVGSGLKSYGKNSKGMGQDYDPQPAKLLESPMLNQQELPDSIVPAPIAQRGFGTVARNMAKPAPMAKGGAVKGLGTVRGLTPRDAGGELDSGPDYVIGEGPSGNGPDAEGLHMDPGSTGTVVPHDQLIADNQQPQTAMVQPKAPTAYAGPAPSVDPERATEQTLVDQKAKDSLAKNDIVGLGSAMLGHRALGLMYGGLGTVQDESTPTLASAGMGPKPVTAMGRITPVPPVTAMAPGALPPVQPLIPNEPNAPSTPGMAKLTDPAGLKARLAQYDAAIDDARNIGDDARVIRLQQARAATVEENPWGGPTNHPSIFGKIGHYAAKVGNVGLDVAAPGTSALIPGTAMNRERQSSMLGSALKSADESQLQSAQASNQLAEAQQRRAELQNPKKEYVPIRTPVLNPATGKYESAVVNKADSKDVQFLGEAQPTAGAAKETPLTAQTAAPFVSQIATVPDTVIAALPKELGATTADKRKAVNSSLVGMNPTEAQAAINGLRQNGEWQAQRDVAASNRDFTQGQTNEKDRRQDVQDLLKTGTNSKGQNLTLNDVPMTWLVDKATGLPIPKDEWAQHAPTMTERNQGETAEVYLKNLPRIKELEGQLVKDGSWTRLQQQWEDFLNGKLGAGADPRFTEMATLLGFSTSGAMKTHFGARGGAQMYPVFKQYFTPVRDQAGFDASIKGATSFMRGYAEEGRIYTKGDWVKDHTLTPAAIQQIMKDHNLTEAQARSQAAASGYEVK
jgi:hypothetical protein